MFTLCTDACVYGKNFACCAGRVFLKRKKKQFFEGLRVIAKPTQNKMIVSLCSVRTGYFEFKNFTGKLDFLYVHTYVWDQLPQWVEFLFVFRKKLFVTNFTVVLG